MRELLHHRWARWATLATMVFVLAAISFRVHTPMIVAVHKGIEGEALKKTIGRLSKNGHAFQVIELPYEELRKAVRDSVHGRESPWRFDVVMVDDPWLPELQDELQLFEPDEDDKDFLESCTQVCKNSKSNDRFFALPYVGNSQLLCYRTGQDKLPPHSWQEVVDFSVEKNNQARFGYVMRVKSGNSILTDFLPILWQADSTSLVEAPLQPGNGEKAEVHLQLGDGAKLAFEQIQKLGEGRRFATASQDDFDLAAYVLGEKASMSIIWSAWAMRLHNLATTNSEVFNHYEFGQVPGTPGQPVLGAWLLAVPKTSGHNKRDAMKFVRDATSRDELVIAALEGNPPPRQSVFDHLKFKNQYKQLSEELRKSLHNAKPRPRTRLWSLVEEQVGACLAELNAGLIATEDSLNGSRDALKQLDDLAKNEGISNDAKASDDEKKEAKTKAATIRVKLKKPICGENRKQKALSERSPIPAHAKTR